MKYFGFLSFGHYSNGGRHGIAAAESLHQAIDLSVAADELGVNGAFFRVHHFAPQADRLLGPGLVEGGVAVGDQVQGCGLLGEIEGVLVAHV